MFEHLKLKLSTCTSLLSYQVYQWWQCLTGELHIRVWAAVPAPLGLTRNRQGLQDTPPAAKEWMKHICRLYRGFPHSSTQDLPLIWVSSQGVFLWWRTRTQSRVCPGTPSRKLHVVSAVGTSLRLLSPTSISYGYCSSSSQLCFSPQNDVSFLLRQRTCM